MHEVLGRPVRDVEFIDPCQPWEDAQPLACGCLALHFDTGVLVIYSRARYSTSEPSPAARALVVSWQEADAWGLLKTRFREAACKRCAATPGFRRESHQQRLLAVDVSGHGNCVLLSWSDAGQPRTVTAAADWDCAMLIDGTASQVPPALALSAMGAYAWLHPAARIPAVLDGHEFRSAAPADWPIGAWRALREQGCSARLADHVRSEALPVAWARLVDRIMEARIRQHPWIRHRLHAIPEGLAARDALAAISMTALPRWRATMGHRDAS